MSAAAGQPVRDGDARPVLRRLLVALIRIALASGSSESARWRVEAVEAQQRLAGRADEIATLKIDEVWNSAIALAERDVTLRRDETVNPTLPTTSPLRPDQLGAAVFDLERAVQAIRDAASFG